jgi:hypothetical protein
LSFPSFCRRAGNGHSARLQVHPRRLTNRTKIFWEKIFWKNGIRKCVDKAENPRRVTVLSKAYPGGTTTFMSVLKMRRAATRALVGDALAIWHDAQPLLQLLS